MKASVNVRRLFGMLAAGCGIDSGSARETRKRQVHRTSKVSGHTGSSGSIWMGLSIAFACLSVAPLASAVDIETITV
jgi:hypothetical protein